MNDQSIQRNIPLAERVRPTTLDSFFGQTHLLGKGKPIRLMIEQDTLSSFMLWGPPGTGKTTIAKLIALRTKSDFFQINAVSSGVKDIRDIIAAATKNRQHHKTTILFIDEIHRFNKAQQDALLSAVESGILTLIGATTENPSFEVISALRSRMRIFTLKELDTSELEKIIENALRSDAIFSKKNINVADKEFLIYLSGGDARNMLNILEAAILQEGDKDEIILSKEIFENVVQKKNIVYDKDGEEHFNLISAFIKSIRGSDPDAAVYWMARMLEGGEDPLFIARRMIILASEDVGNASPNALLLAEACFSAVEKIGMPESRIILSQCATYLASSAKSNASYIAIEKAFQDVKGKPLYKVPLHLRNAPTSFMKNLGYGKEYKYAHDFEDHFVEENYFPEEMKGTQYYFPQEIGQEKKIAEWLKFLWKKLKKY